MRISDWSSDVCSSYLVGAELALHQGFDLRIVRRLDGDIVVEVGDGGRRVAQHEALAVERQALCQRAQVVNGDGVVLGGEQLATGAPGEGGALPHGLCRLRPDERSAERRVGKECGSE